jgi:hypothetical protein
MTDQFSGKMLLELMRTVEKAVPSHINGFRIGPEQRKALALMRQSMLSNEQETTPLKTAWLSMIDQCLSDSPSPDGIFAAIKEVDRLSPARGSKAIGVNLL